MMNENIIELKAKLDSLETMLLINSLTNVVNSPMYSDEVRKSAALKVEELLGLALNREFSEQQEVGLPNNVIR